MLIYWILFTFAALMALTNRRHNHAAPKKGMNSQILLVTFALLYIVIGGLRFETGGDWLTYGWMYTQLSYSSIGFALAYTDPIFGLLNWFSAQIGMGIYLVNAVVCAILVVGVIRVAGLTRDPWLGIMIAVPYILIVIGMGYLRQAAAIGMLLMAIHSLEKHRRLRSLLYLALAAGFHSTSIIVIPLFVAAISRRYAIYALLIAALSAFAYSRFLEPRLDAFEAGYIGASYESEGAFIRLLMGALPGAVIILRWRHFGISGPSRPIWFLIAAGTLGLMALFFLIPSSTAVDRLGLYFSIIQIVTFGELLNILKFRDRDALYIRVLAITLAAAVQVVWLVYAVHAQFWLPYRSIFDAA